MASFQLYTDPLESCPYNPAHRLKRSRMQIHLTKCRRNHIDMDLRECPFNAQHRIPPSEYQHHLSICPDRRSVERQIICASDQDHQGNTAVPSYKVEIQPSEEFWDEVPSTRPGYDPRKKLDGGDLILIPKGQPVDRRNAYKNLFAKTSEKNILPAATCQNVNAVVIQPRHQSEIKPMRIPNTIPEVIQMTSNIGRGQRTVVRRKIAANIFGGTMGTSPCSQDFSDVRATGCVAPGSVGVAIGLGRGMGRGSTAGFSGLCQEVSLQQVPRFDKEVKDGST